MSYATAVAEAWTIRSVVAFCADDLSRRGIESARLDAQLLVAHALGIDRVRLFMDLDRPLTPDERARIRELLQRRRAREPIAYLLGRREFHGRSFAVGPAVLVPRPDTETLVERALVLLPADAEGPVLDLCTGSGCIAITLAAERPSLTVHATDLSPEALEVAARNAAALGVQGRVVLRPGDLFGAVPPDTRYRLVTANPPYVAERDRATLAPDVVDHEPHLALFAGQDGLDRVRQIAADAPAYLEPGGTILVEIGAEQGQAAAGLFAAAGLEVARPLRDLGGRDRVIEARKPG